MLVGMANLLILEYLLADRKSILFNNILHRQIGLEMLLKFNRLEKSLKLLVNHNNWEEEKYSKKKLVRVFKICKLCYFRVIKNIWLIILYHQHLI